MRVARDVRETVLDVATVAVALATVTIAANTVYSQFVGSGARGVRGRQPPALVENWEELVSVGHRLGPVDAPITVVAFSDFECHMCAAFANQTYPELERRYPGRTALVYRHWPLPQHRCAYPAAKAAECADVQGRFRQYHDLLYTQQEMLGFKTFHEFAKEAGVPDLQAFSQCYAREEPVPAIERDIAAVRAIGGTGTPTVVLNGWLFRGGVDVELLDSIAQQSRRAKRRMTRVP